MKGRDMERKTGRAKGRDSRPDFLSGLPGMVIFEAPVPVPVQLKSSQTENASWGKELMGERGRVCVLKRTGVGRARTW